MKEESSTGATESMSRELTRPDMVNHPKHYQDASGIECIEITEPLGYSLGNAVKYVYRYNDKGDPVENLKKAMWFLNRVIDSFDGDISFISIPLRLSFESSASYSHDDDQFQQMANRWKNNVLALSKSRMTEGDSPAATFFLALAAGSVPMMHDIVERMISILEQNDIDDHPSVVDTVGDYKGADHD